MKNGYNIFKTDESNIGRLLQKYSKHNLYYRSEEFSQTAELFVSRIASDKRIPNSIKAHFPLYQILISLCKVFMLNEYEIASLACTLDHCAWKIDEVILPQEQDFLGDFPLTEVEITSDCKRFIMYLMVLTFSIKQYLNEKSEIDPIQVFCERVCKNFHVIFNRWVSSFPALQRFNYSAPELNKKYKTLSSRLPNPAQSNLKDYNSLVENIMALTGSYNSKSRTREHQTNAFTPPTLPTEPSPESKVVYSEGPLAMNIEKVFSRQGTFESNPEERNNNSNFFFFNNNFVPPTSFSQLSTTMSQGKKNHAPVDLTYDNTMKKLKFEASNLYEAEEEVKIETHINENFEAGNNSLGHDEFFNMTPLVKKPSFRLSQLSDDFASAPQWNFSLTFSQENK